jgi:hypothetical protein
MKHLVKGVVIAAVLAVAAPAWAQSSSEYLNSAELYRLAVAAAVAKGAPAVYPWAPYPYPYPYVPATADPKTYPLPYYPFAPLAVVPGTGGNWKWENGAYHWYPNS